MSSALPPIQPEELAAFAFLNEAAISPDGTRVAFTVRREVGYGWLDPAPLVGEKG